MLKILHYTEYREWHHINQIQGGGGGTKSLFFRLTTLICFDGMQTVDGQNWDLIVVIRLAFLHVKPNCYWTSSATILVPPYLFLLYLWLVLRQQLLPQLLVSWRRERSFPPTSSVKIFPPISMFIRPRNHNSQRREIWAVGPSPGDLVQMFLQRRKKYSSPLKNFRI